MGETAELLRKADAALSLPRLGGMARPNGVVIVSERHWAFAGVDGSLREGRMPHPPERLQRLPLARGLVRLWSSLAPVLRPGGVAPSRERYLILTALLAPLGLALPSLADRPLPMAPAFWSPLVVLVLSLALTMELWRLVQKSSQRFWHAFLVPGLALQRVTTREPRLDETQVALRAVAAVLRHELS